MYPFDVSFQDLWIGRVEVALLTLQRREIIVHCHGMPQHAFPAPCLEGTLVAFPDLAMHTHVFGHLQAALCLVGTLVTSQLSVHGVMGLDMVVQIRLLARLVIAVPTREIPNLFMDCPDMLLEISTSVCPVVA